MKKFNIKLLVGIITGILMLIIIILLSFNIKVTIADEKNNSETLTILFIIFSIFFFISCAVLLCFTYLEKLKRINSSISKINSINFAQEEIFEVGIIIFDENLNITFITPWLLSEGFESFLGKKTNKLLGINLLTMKIQTWEFAGRWWEIFISTKNKSILLKDITYTKSLDHFIITQQKSILYINTSFSKKINFHDALKTELNLKVQQASQEWAKKVKGIYNSTVNNEGTSSIIFNWTNGMKYIYSEDILKYIKKSLLKNLDDITISIGVSFGGESYIDLQEKSLKALEISKNRGGDQIVVEKPNGETVYIGISSQQNVSNNMINTKKFHITISSNITKAKEVFITSHILADLDAVGSALGIWQLINDINKNIYIVIETMDSTTEKLFDLFPKYIKDLFISEKKAIKLSSNRSYIIIVDTSSPEATQAPKLISEYSSPGKIFVIDHHRLNKAHYEFEEDKLLIDTSISSSSELVVEMLKQTFGPDAQEKLDSNVSTSLLSGIKLDTKNLTKNVSNLTFEAISFLMNNEANTQEVNILFKQSQDLLKYEAEAIENIVKISKDIIFTYISEDIIIPDEATSIIADKFLEYEGIEATFVLAKVSSKKYKLSSRSNGNINVQHIAEELGGGGHFSVSATTWSTNIKYTTVKKRIIAAISKIKKNK